MTMVDLAAAKAPGLGCPWIMPLTEPLRKRAWDVPLDQWDEHLELPDMLAGRELSRKSNERP